MKETLKWSGWKPNFIYEKKIVNMKNYNGINSIYKENSRYLLLLQTIKEIMLDSYSYYFNMMKKQSCKYSWTENLSSRI